jgi:hypothetical protein
MVSFNYKIDTGANCTTINYESLFRLGFDENWIRGGTLLQGDYCPTTASGALLKDCYRVILPEINIGGFVGYNWPFTTSLSVPFRLLLGTDSIKFFNWVFDYGNEIFRFTLVKDKRKLLFDGFEQSIHTIDEINYSA